MNFDTEYIYLRVYVYFDKEYIYQRIYKSISIFLQWYDVAKIKKYDNALGL